MRRNRFENFFSAYQSVNCIKRTCIWFPVMTCLYTVHNAIHKVMNGIPLCGTSLARTTRSWNHNQPDHNYDVTFPYFLMAPEINFSLELHTWHVHVHVYVHTYICTHGQTANKTGNMRTHIFFPIIHLFVSIQMIHETAISSGITCTY